MKASRIAKANNDRRDRFGGPFFFLPSPLFSDKLIPAAEQGEPFPVF